MGYEPLFQTASQHASRETSSRRRFDAQHAETLTLASCTQKASGQAPQGRRRQRFGSRVCRRSKPNPRRPPRPLARGPWRWRPSLRTPPRPPPRAHAPTRLRAHAPTRSLHAPTRSLSALHAPTRPRAHTPPRPLASRASRAAHCECRGLAYGGLHGGHDGGDIGVGLRADQIDRYISYSCHSITARGAEPGAARDSQARRASRVARRRRRGAASETGGIERCTIAFQIKMQMQMQTWTGR